MLFPDVLAKIDSRFAEKITCAFAESTQKNFKSQCVTFIDFCNLHTLPVYPLDYTTVVRYLTVCSDKVTSYGTIINKLSALTKFYALSGYVLDHKHPSLDMLVRACKRQMSSDSKPKAALEPGHLLLIPQTLDAHNLAHTLF